MSLREKKGDNVAANKNHYWKANPKNPSQGIIATERTRLSCVFFVCFVSTQVMLKNRIQILAGFKTNEFFFSF